MVRVWQESIKAKHGQTHFQLKNGFLCQSCVSYELKDKPVAFKTMLEMLVVLWNLQEMIVDSDPSRTTTRQQNHDFSVIWLQL